MTDKPADFTETQVSSKTVYQGKLLHVLEDDVRLPDGGRARREYIRHPGAAMILPLLEPEVVVLVRQFRYPLGRHFYEIPAGKLDPGEAPLQAAQRELREECGYQAADWRRLATLHPCIGYSSEAIELYCASGLTHVGSNLEAGEFLETVPLRLDEALRRVRDGTITDAKTVIGLLWWEAMRRGA